MTMKLPTAIAGYFAADRDDFRGSPIDLRFHFVLENELIAKLEVTP